MTAKKPQAPTDPKVAAATAVRKLASAAETARQGVGIAAEALDVATRTHGDACNGLTLAIDRLHAGTDDYVETFGEDPTW